MSESTKTNDYIRSNHKEFQAAYLRARKELGAIPGVLGVGYGHVSTAGEFKVGLGFQVFVREKRAAADLSPEELIPRSFEGYRVDVRVAQALREQESNPDYLGGTDAREPVIMGGIQIEPRKKSLSPTGPCMAAGTLGCLVRKRRSGSADDNVYLLTNHHVLTAAGCDTHDYVYQPYASKTTDTAPGLFLGAVDYAIFKGEVPYKTFSPYIDCGIAKIDVGSVCCGSTCGEARVKYSHTIKGLGPDTTPASPFKDWITDVRDVCGDTTIFVDVPRDQYGQITNDDVALRAALVTGTAANKVRKVGRSTGRTVGIVVGVNVIGFESPGNTLTVLHDMIEIMIDPTFQGSLSVLPGQNRRGQRSFSDNGDSGSIVVDRDNKAIGILFGGPPLVQRPGSQYEVTWASHIVPVLDKLGVYIVTKGGTSHGSDGATDGSGLAANLSRGTPGVPPGLVLASADSAATEDVAQESQLSLLRDRIQMSDAGRQLFALLSEHQREISYIVRNSRAGKTAWHRLEGPAFLAQTLNHLRGDAPRMPNENRGVRRATLLARLRTILMSDGSYLLRQALECQGDTLMALAEAETFDDCLDILKRLDAVETIA